jgi:hypothetical protein
MLQAIVYTVLVTVSVIKMFTLDADRAGEIQEVVIMLEDSILPPFTTVDKENLTLLAVFIVTGTLFMKTAVIPLMNYWYFG